MKIKLGVIYGGKTVEHEISVISAVQAMGYLDEDKYEVIPIYITKDLEWYTGDMLKDIASYKDFALIKRYAKKVNLINKKDHYVLQSTKLFKRVINEIDLALPIVHGSGMEDGSIQGYLELVGVPYVGSNVYASVVGQDKVFMKQIFDCNRIPIVDYVWFFENEYFEDRENLLKRINKLKYPLIVKPATLGSSIGISKITSKEQLIDAIEEAIRYDVKVVVEEVIEDLTEVNCSVLGTYEKMETSEIEEVIKEDEILSYNDKYIGDAKCKGASKGMASTRRIMPARLSKSQKEEIEELSRKVFRALNTSGVTRIDYLIDNKRNRIFVNEINTIPGSLAFYLWEPKNMSYTELLDSIINSAIRTYKKKSKMTYSFDTNILQSFNANGLKGIKK